ncbi:hypothetical protein MTO96_045219, partial [Rhipicephalus appendiculatus]
EVWIALFVYNSGKLLQIADKGVTTKTPPQDYFTVVHANAACLIIALQTRSLGSKTYLSAQITMGSYRRCKGY